MTDDKAPVTLTAEDQFDLLLWTVIKKVKLLLNLLGETNFNEVAPVSEAFLAELGENNCTVYQNPRGVALDYRVGNLDGITREQEETLLKKLEELGGIEILHRPDNSDWNNSDLFLLAVFPRFDEIYKEYEQKIKYAGRPGLPGLEHDPDYRWVSLRGEAFYLTTPRRAKVLKFMAESYENGIPELHQSSILGCLDTNDMPDSLSDLFKDSEVLGKLIISGEKKGFYRLNI